MTPRLRLFQEEFRAADFRLYRSSDVIGVDISAAMKNVIADLRPGWSKDLGLGQNAHRPSSLADWPRSRDLGGRGGSSRRCQRATQGPPSVMCLGEFVLPCT